jgi:hypothetical protein
MDENVDSSHNSTIAKELASVLVRNIEDDNIKEKDIDLIISGGAFNVSYLVGCLYFIDEMRDKGLIRINKISTCSASSMLGLLYLINKVDFFVDKLYELLITSFKKNKCVIFDDESLAIIMNIIEKEIPDDILVHVNDRLYITYYDVKKCKQIVKSNYENVTDILNTIKRSCFIPYITMNKFMEDDNYIDGGTPFIFDKIFGKNRLYINLCGMDKVIDSIVIKKDKIVTHRILGGVLDIHDFFFRCKRTSMCSYVEDWGVIGLLSFKVIEIRIYSICIFMYIITRVKCNILDKYYKDNKFIILIYDMMREMLSKTIEKYCV